MSYRRMNSFPKQQQQQNTPLSSVGMRRQPHGNFAGGQGQLMNKGYPPHGLQNKQPQQQVQQQQQHFQPQMQQQEKPKPVQQQQMQNQAKGPVQAQKPMIAPVPKPQPTNVQQPTEPPKVNLLQNAEDLIAEHGFVTDTPMPTDSVAGEEGDNATPQKSKPFWMKRNGRVNKVERAKRRNVRLRKLLQPKNALMIINELVGHVTFDLSETKNEFEDIYKANVSVEGEDFSGFGKSKALAKTAAAETAVRGMILKKLKIMQNPLVSEEENKEDVKMEVNEENQEDVSWTHIASFAIHKLFSSWGDDGNMADMLTRTNSVVSLDAKDGVIPSLQAQPEQKPAKKLPDTAATMNPIMLLNQMHPYAKYEELGKIGTPPNIQFTMKCTVGTQSFVGNGPNKKAARKQAALEACRTLLGIQYSPDILDGTAMNKSMDTS